MTRARIVAAQAAYTAAVIIAAPVVITAGIAVAVRLAWQARKDRS